MILSFTAIDKNAQLRNFSCMLDGLEVALDVLTTIVSFGDTILDAQVEEDDSAIQLPCEVFDGESMSVHIQQLEQEWQAILSEPFRSPKTDGKEELLSLTRRRVTLYETRINLLNQASSTFESLIRQTEEALPEGIRKNQLLDRYRSTLSRHQRLVKRSKVDYMYLLERLSQLTAA
ncbi:hypothetical protein BN8_00802 [Fibrisoma limi BUZ 3]|uniref:Uncharacterized protein n=1 Tax=Fibrisoma limi BUZ 3 TaxID=1185876 RepID=I2GD75_9BACT|nr:hypothetical protein [Fibrisoma limi]CCH51849.1 hypothetical protein BN8_00802 [Fibrisoma limi BUZ 3]